MIQEKDHPQPDEDVTRIEHMISEGGPVIIEETHKAPPKKSNVPPKIPLATHPPV